LVVMAMMVGLTARYMSELVIGAPSVIVIAGEGNAVPTAQPGTG
jgi:hypothetical protein